MCTLAHVFELAGLATIVLTPMRDIAERIKVPRALYTAFPLGLSLGKPGDKEFQHKVLKWSFSLLDEPKGPVVKAFPDQINVAEGNQITCPLPPRMNLNLLILFIFQLLQVQTKEIGQPHSPSLLS